MGHKKSRGHDGHVSAVSSNSNEEWKPNQAMAEFLYMFPSYSGSKVPLHLREIYPLGTRAPLLAWQICKEMLIHAAVKDGSSIVNHLFFASLLKRFRAASSFNADISFWETAQVRDMSTMFW